MVTVSTTSYTVTYFDSYQFGGTTFSHNSATYTDVTDTANGGGVMQLANVPDGAKIYYHLSAFKTTAGGAAGDKVRITDGTNVFAEHTNIGTSSTIKQVDVSGSITNNSGGVATVKIQTASADGNNINLFQSWMVITDADNVYVMSNLPITSPIYISGKRNIDTIYAALVENQPPSGGETATVAGLSVSSEDTGLGSTKAQNPVGHSFNLNVMTNDIMIDVSDVTWSTVTSAHFLIWAYSGVNIEVSA